VLGERASGVPTYVGEYATSMEMAGASIPCSGWTRSFAATYAAPADTPFFKQFAW
jgi:dihydroxyacetone kinase